MSLPSLEPYVIIPVSDDTKALLYRAIEGQETNNPAYGIIHGTIKALCGGRTETDRRRESGWGT